MFEPYKPFSKIPRLHGRVVVTEKIDGTNASVEFAKTRDCCTMAAGSRNRRLVTVSWLHEREQFPEVEWHGPDNAGFGAWFLAHYLELRQLGYGQHFGEWYGKGIQRGYGLDHKRFALFRTDKDVPACCEKVPVLLDLPDFNMQSINFEMERLNREGSRAVPGFSDPEGIIVWHERSGHLFKYPFDSAPKGSE